MTKLLRKYNKWLLGIGGSLLMVTFLLTGPQSIFQPNPMKRVVATMGKESVHQSDIVLADKELEALKSYVPMVISTMHIENGPHWMLLAREAQEAGLIGAEGDGKAWLPELGKLSAQVAARQEVARQFGQMGEQLVRAGYLNQQIDQKAAEFVKPATEMLEANHAIVASRNRITESQLDMALAKLRGMTRLEEQYMTAARISDRRAVSEVKRFMDRVLVDAVIIPATKLTDGIAEPAEPQIAEQYVKYQNIKPGTGDYGFGYLQPQRVKFEWLCVSRDAIGATLSIDPVDVNKYWLQHKDKYKGEFSADRAQVETDLKNTKIDQVISDADRYYKSALRNFTRNLAQDGPFRKLPADWDKTGPKMQDLATALTTSMKPSYPQLPAPTLGASTDKWTRIKDAGAVPDLGSARYRIGNKQGTFSELLGELHELNAASSAGLQARLPYENPLIDSKGNYYYINVLDYRNESAPENPAEVRADVIKDIKLLAAFEKLKSEQPTYQLLAVREGLDAVSNLFATPAAAGAANQAPTPLPVMRLANVRRESADGMLNVAPIRDALMAAAEALGQQFKASPENVAQRTLSIPIPEQLSVAIVQIQGQSPATVEDLRTQSKGVFDNFAQNELMKAAVSAPFNFDAMKVRYNYKPINVDESTKAGSGSAPRPDTMP